MSYKNLIVLNGRLERDKESKTFQVPQDQILVITDIVIQNRKPGDEPVDVAAFSRIDIGQVMQFDTNLNRKVDLDIFFTIVGNETLNVHLKTGMVARTGFRILNMINSNAPFIEYTITGFLTDRPVGL